MIPKVIHYCWFGRNPLPTDAKKCIESWRKYMPDYEIKEWNENNFDVNSIPYTQEAYKAKKYAFVSDYARFWILYNYGGVYFDTDVQVIKSMDDIISKGPFMGCEIDAKRDLEVPKVNPGLGLAVNPGLGLFKEMLELYSTLHFINLDGSYNQKTIVAYTTEMLLKHGLKSISGIQECAGVFIYPTEYFCPLSFETKKLNITNNTRSIHLFSASWVSKSSLLKIKLYRIIKKCIGEKKTKFLLNVVKKIKGNMRKYKKLK